MMSKFSCVAFLCSLLFFAPVSAGQLSGIGMRVVPDTAGSGSITLGIVWEESADDATLLLDAPEGVSMLLPDGEEISGSRTADVGPVAAGEELQVRICGLRQGDSALITARRQIDGRSYQLVTPLAFRAGGFALGTGREYLIRAAEEEDFSGFESPDPAGGAVNRVEEDAIVVEALNPKFADTVFAEDTASHAIGDGPIDCTGPTLSRWKRIRSNPAQTPR